MKEDPQFVEDHQDQPDVHQLLTAEMRQELVQLKGKMAGYAVCLDDLCRKLEPIEDATVRAKEAAKSLLDDDALQALVAIRRLQKATERKVHENCPNIDCI